MTKLGVAHLNALELPPEALIPACAKAGFQATGLRIHPVSAGGVCYPLPPGSEALRRVKAVLQAEGIGVNEVEFIEISPSFNAADFAWMMEAGAELGASCVTVAGEDPDFARMTANFAALCDLAAPHGLRVDVEFMRWRVVGTLQQAQALVAAAARPNGAILLDSLHLARSGGAPADVRAVPPGMLRAVQVCDGPAVAPATTEGLITEAREARLPPGQGELPLKDLLAALPRDVVFSAEVPMRGMDPQARLTLACQATRRLLQQVSGR